MNKNSIKIDDIINEYSELNKACRQYPKIQLESIESRGGYVAWKNVNKPVNKDRVTFKKK